MAGEGQGNRHPDEATCEAMLDAARTPEPTRRHIRAVTELAVTIAERLVAAGVALDVDLVRAAAMLHDIDKGCEDHAAMGARRVAAAGYPEVADIVAGHMDMAFRPGDPISEGVVVVLADKLVSGDRAMSLEKRFAATFARLEGDNAALAAAEAKKASIRRLLDAVEARIGAMFSVD
jgi:putative nucleotidyltransferase with HDIG domain